MKSRFIGRDPEFKIGNKKGEWILTKQLSYYSDLIGLVFVPVGFSTDLASIPKIFRGAISVNEEHRKPAIVHDWLYVSRKLFTTRKICDLVFLEAMEISGVPKWKRNVMYVAVRAGGWIYWYGCYGKVKNYFHRIKKTIRGVF